MSLTLFSRPVYCAGCGSMARVFRFMSSAADTGSHVDFARKKKMQSANVPERIQEHLKESSVVVYMKGQPSAPSCGFSWKTIQILNSLNARYTTHDVLQDEDLRAGIKQYTGWPTIPQVFIGGEFVGGADIIEQMARTGELTTLLERTCNVRSAPGHESDRRS